MYGYPTSYKYGTGGGYPGVSVASFTPATPAGLILWNKFNTGLYQDAAKTTPASGTDAVGAWEDQSGNGNDITQGTAADRPTLASGALTFDGTNDELDGAASLVLKPITIFVLVNFTDLTGNRRVVSSRNPAGISLDTNGTTLRLLKTETSLIGSSTTAMSTGSYLRLIVTYDASGNYAFYVNGAAAGSGTNDVTISDDSMVLGAPTVFLDGLVKEWGLYDNALSAGNITSLDTYLSTV